MEHGYVVLQNKLIRGSLEFGKDNYCFTCHDPEPHLVAICETMDSANGLIEKLEDDLTKGTFYVKEVPYYCN